MILPCRLFTNNCNFRNDFAVVKAVVKNFFGRHPAIAINDSKDPKEIINQFKAAEEALSNAHFLLLEDVFRKGLALQLSDVIKACPGNCEDAAKLLFCKKNFPS